MATSKSFIYSDKFENNKKRNETFSCVNSDSRKEMSDFLGFSNLTKCAHCINHNLSPLRKGSGKTVINRNEQMEMNSSFAKSNFLGSSIPIAENLQQYEHFLLNRRNIINSN